MIDERAKGAWTDIVAADEAEPVEPLLVAQPDALAMYAHVTPERSPIPWLTAAEVTIRNCATFRSAIGAGD